MQSLMLGLVLLAPFQAQEHRGGWRLADAASPYLREHAGNPVEWYPWGDEALAKAKELHRPIFLSIGYSSCHWCHVMERESFEDAEIARFLEEHFVSIKVDREERPDLDALYLDYVIARTGNGGWPLTVVLTPDRKPFFGGTYFPPRNRDATPGLLEILRSIQDAFAEDPDRIEQDAAKAVEVLRRRAALEMEPMEWSLDLVDAAAQQYAQIVDLQLHSGRGGPRFPDPMRLGLLLDYAQRSGDAEALRAHRELLDAMATGGIRDPIGGGFMRYATDPDWNVPHFEKMLYVNAQLARVYADAYRGSHDPRDAAVVRTTLDYMLRDLRLPSGAFATAEDADSAGGEGAFYVFTAKEVDASLQDDLSAVARETFGIGEEASIPNTRAATRHGPDAIERARAALFEFRAKRPRPIRDDKALADCNGLAISALAHAGRVLQEPRYRDAALAAADAMWASSWDEATMQLHRSAFDGRPSGAGQLGDYAMLAQGYLDLYESTFVPNCLERAERLVRRAEALFSDAESGVYFDAPEGDASLLLRPRHPEDGALPSATAILLKDQVRLARMLPAEDLEARARRCLDAYASTVRADPLDHAELLRAMALALAPPREVVFAEAPGAADFEALIDAWYAKPRPTCVLLATSGIDNELTRDKTAVDGAAAAYVCENRVCKRPVTDPKDL